MVTQDDLVVFQAHKAPEVDQLGAESVLLVLLFKKDSLLSATREG